jgi:hypothetical protein
VVLGPRRLILSPYRKATTQQGPSLASRGSAFTRQPVKEHCFYRWQARLSCRWRSLCCEEGIDVHLKWSIRPNSIVFREVVLLRFVRLGKVNIAGNRGCLKELLTFKQKSSSLSVASYCSRYYKQYLFASCWSCFFSSSSITSNWASWVWWRVSLRRRLWGLDHLI